MTVLESNNNESYVALFVTCLQLISLKFSNVIKGINFRGRFLEEVCFHRITFFRESKKKPGAKIRSHDIHATR